MLITSRIFILIFIISFPVLAIDSDTNTKVEQLNRESMNTLGVSLRALAYLVKASKASYMPLNILEKFGGINFIYELKSKGYIRIDKFKGLPDGTEKDKVFINIVPIGKGIEIQSSFLNLRNNGPGGESRKEIEQIDFSKSLYDIKVEAEQMLKKIEQRNKGDDQLMETLKQQLKAIKKDVDGIAAEEAERNDLNNDGVQDVFFEGKDDGYFVLTDRNFDGKIDDRWKYNLDDTVHSGESDNNFDGVFETRYLTHNGFTHEELIDSDNNGIYDIYSKFESGVWIYSEKYYGISKAGEQARIGRVEMDLSKISGSEVFIATKISESEFQKERLK